MCGKLINLVICALLLSATSLVAQLVAQTQPGPPVHSQVVLPGAGDPAADPDQSGPATAIVVNGQAYLVDLGAGVVRRAKAAVVERGIKALEPTNLRIAFITHLHSDHTVGYPDLILTPWVLGRRVPIEVYGPTGTNAMTEHLLEAYRLDFETRTNAVTGSGGQIPEGHVVHAHEIRAGMCTRTKTLRSPRFRRSTQWRAMGTVSIPVTEALSSRAIPTRHKPPLTHATVATF